MDNGFCILNPFGDEYLKLFTACLLVRSKIQNQSTKCKMYIL